MRLRAALGIFVGGFAAAMAMGQQTVPDIGKLMIQSPQDFKNIQSGCVHAFDSKGGHFVCATTNQLAGTVVPVTLAIGTMTTVSSTAVKATSRVRCGCEACAGTSSAASCSGGAEWTPRIAVRSVSAGSFEITHGYATGVQQTCCVVEG